MSKELYFSTDVETNGPIPGPNSMLSFASAVFTPDGEMVGSYEANLDLLPGARPDPATAKWWTENQAAYDATRSNTRPPEVEMSDYVAWVGTFAGCGRPVFVAYPAGFDFLFMYWYMIRFAGRSPFSFSALDIKSFAMAKLGCGYRDASKKRFPKRWFSDRPHTHRALDDAIEQGEMFVRMLRDAGP